MSHHRSIQRMHKDEVLVHDDTVRALLKDQLPHWADRRLLRIADSGTDNAIYRLGDDLGIRLPRVQWAEAQIDKECRWLPRLAAGLPTAVPIPVAEGRPGVGYEFRGSSIPGWKESASIEQWSKIGMPSQRT